MLQQAISQVSRLCPQALRCSLGAPALQPWRIAIGNAALWLAVLLLGGPPPGGGSAS
jgi:hypothetical protein